MIIYTVALGWCDENGYAHWLMPNAVVSEDAGIVTVRFERDNKLNAIDSSMLGAVQESVRALAERDDLRCLVITGQGRYFTAGFDMKDSSMFWAGDPGAAFRRFYRCTYHALYDELEAVEKPVVLAAQGNCYGAGVEMAVSCDFRFCTPRAVFAVPEVHIGLFAGSGGTSRLTRLVGPGWGKWMAMAGKPVTADQALRIGLVHDVFDEDGFMDSVYDFCRELISVPSEVLGLSKLAVDIYTDVHDRTVQRHIDRIIVSGTMNSQEFFERTDRFRQ